MDETSTKFAFNLRDFLKNIKEPPTILAIALTGTLPLM